MKKFLNIKIKNKYFGFYKIEQIGKEKNYIVLRNIDTEMNGILSLGSRNSCPINERYIQILLGKLTDYSIVSGIDVMGEWEEGQFISSVCYIGDTKKVKYNISEEWYTELVLPAW